MNKGASPAPGVFADQLIPPGVIWEWAGTALPDPALYGRWAWADGSAVSRSQYPRLFAHVGVAHGAGDGSTTFNLPNRNGKVGVGKDGTTEFLTVGQTGGAKASTAVHTHSLSHTHDMRNHSHTLGGHWHGLEQHWHGLGGHGHTVNSHGHNLDNHSHGGGTGYHAHSCLNNIYRTGTPAHGHDGAGDQSSERPNVTTGFSSPGNPTNSVGVGNSGQGNSESPGTGGPSTGSDWFSGPQGAGGPNGGSDGPNLNTSDGASATTTTDSSATASSGNLPPYVAMNYIVKV